MSPGAVGAGGGTEALRRGGGGASATGTTELTLERPLRTERERNSLASVLLPAPLPSLVFYLCLPLSKLPRKPINEGSHSGSQQSWGRVEMLAQSHGRPLWSKPMLCLHPPVSTCPQLLPLSPPPPRCTEPLLLSFRVGEQVLVIPSTSNILPSNQF